MAIPVASRRGTGENDVRCSSRPLRPSVRSDWNRSTRRTRRFKRRTSSEPARAAPAMKLENLAEGADECPLIRMFDVDSRQIAALRRACHELAGKRITSFLLHDEPWMTADRRLIRQSGRRDCGLRRIGASASSQLDFRVDRFQFVAGVVDFHLPVDAALGAGDINGPCSDFFLK